jgi:adenylate cyclase
MIIVGFFYQTFTEGSFDYNAIVVGLFLGLSFGILELFVLRKLNWQLKRLPFHQMVTIKAILYTFIVLIISNLIGLIQGYFAGKTLDEFYASLLTKGRVAMILTALVSFAIIIVFLQIRRLLGEGVLLKFLTGKYHSPVEEERIFMFLDMKSSTSIAEKIGHKSFYSLLNSFFHDITEPVLITKAEIYQYVGDEIVFTWKMKEGIENINCLRIFFLIEKRIEERKQEYIQEYGTIPQFKAGIHYGHVIVGQIGDLKREIVYNGDVLNTTSRIQELCNTYNQDLLISRKLLLQLKLDQNYKQNYYGKVKLRGKESDIHLYGISQ